MAHSHLLSKCFASSLTKQEEETYQNYRDLIISTLPTVEVEVECWAKHEVHQFNGWFGTMPVLASTMVAQTHFQARPTDILLASIPKSGTTWLKALLFATINRNSHSINPHHLFENHSPHECVPFLEFRVYINDRIPNLDSLPSPRLFATHIPFLSLPDSIVKSGCKIVYICRNPKDTFISLWHFINKVRVRDGKEILPLKVGFDHFCNGISIFGPYWDHVLGYWTASLEDRNEVLFMRYEELMEDPVAQLKRLAEFVGFPFTAEEEKGGVAEEIARLCGFESLSNLEVNKAGTMEMLTGTVDNHIFFRRGGVGDWVNHLTPEMARQVDEITERKFRGSGLAL